MHALLGAMQTRLDFDGSLSNTTGSSSTVTSSTRTIRGSGVLLLDGLSEAGASNAQYSKNGAAFADVTEGLTLTVGPGNTLAVRATGMAISDSTQFNIKRNAGGSSIQTVVLTRIS